MKKALKILALFFVILTVCYSLVSFFLPLELPSAPESSVLYDVHNVELWEIIYSWSIRHRHLVYADIPLFYIDALISLEDKTFWSHPWLSARGIVRSLLRNVESGRVVEWASTITTQLIRNAFWINEKRDIQHKFLESIYAIRLEHLLTKEEILSEYINRVSFGYLNVWLKSASLYYFGKEPKNLTKAEQIALLVLPKNPTKYDPYRHRIEFQKRFENLVETLQLNGVLSSIEAKNILTEKLLFRENHEQKLPFVLDFLRKAEYKDASIQTTFDLWLTETIDSVSREVLDELAWRNVSDYGILIAERTSSWPLLRVMIGWKNYHEVDDWQVNTTLSLRQPGSTIKPFTYALAFRDLWFSPESTITDLPVQYKTAEGYSYEPKNYSSSYQGEVTLREALSQSINIPAVKVLEQVQVGNLLDFLRSLEITSLTENADHYGLALTLWDGEVTLYELLQAYSIFAYDGNFCRINFLSWINSFCKPVLEKRYTDMVASILSDRYTKLPGFPLNSALDFPDRWVAFKTGTSRNFRDNWTIGWTRHYMIGVWTGNKNGENMKWVSGATGAWEIFARLVYALEKQEEINGANTYENTGNFYREITSPLDGSEYELNPNKDQWVQQIALKFSSNLSYDTFYWNSDGKKISGSFLSLVPGKHSVEIVLEKEGKTIDRISSTYTVKEGNNNSLVNER